MDIKHQMGICLKKLRSWLSVTSLWIVVVWGEGSVDVAQEQQRKRVQIAT